MKCLKQYTYLYRKSFASTSIHYNHSFIIPVSYKYTINRSFCSSKKDDQASQDGESKIQQQLTRGLAKQIASTTPLAMERYHKEIAPKERVLSTGEVVIDDGEGDYSQEEDKKFKAHIFGMPRATFRGLILTISCLIGATCFILLRPSPISPDKDRSNMHYFARLNADPSVHVTYSGLMYKIMDQIDLNNENTDIHLLTSPNTDIHCVDIDYEGRFIDGTVFDSTFNDNDNDNNITPCQFPAKSLIVGLHQGIQNMTRSSVFEFYIPPHLAYGERGSEFVPPHEPLIFKVRLNDFWKDQKIDRPRRFKLIG